MRRYTMDVNKIQNEKQTPKIALAAFYLGIGSIVALIASVLLGILVESIGVVTFFSAVTPLALAAVVCGLIAKNKIIAEKSAGQSTATIGLILGALVLVIIVVFRIGVFLFFIPWLGA
jgi:hypothetical protein